MASEDLIAREERIREFVTVEVSTRRYGNHHGASAPDRHQIMPGSMGYLSGLEVVSSGHEDDFRLILALEGLTALQVEAILTIVAAIGVEEKNFI